MLFQVLIIGVQFLFTVVFRRKSLPDFIDKLDWKLTNLFTDAQRESLVSKMNAILATPPVYQIIQWRLRNNLKKEHVDLPYKIDLDPKEYFAREQRKLDVTPDRRYWSNWVSTHTSEPLRILYPGTGKALWDQFCKNEYPVDPEYDFTGLKQLQRLVRFAEEKKVRIKCVASGHALSDVAVTTDLLVNTDLLIKPLRRANQSYIKEQFRNGYTVETFHGGTRRTENRYLFETGSGTKIVDLKQVLLTEKLAFQNLGGSDVQGIFGAVSTSTHGTGMELPPFCDMVKSIMIIAAGGKAFRLEPKDGVTDPIEYSKSEERTKHGIELIQDDDLFFSAVCSMGCFGIVFSFIMQVMDVYYLSEQRVPSTWEDEKQKILAEGLDYLKQNRHIDFTINPYPTNEKGDYDKNGKHFCLVNRRDYTSLTQDDIKQNQKEDYTSLRRNFLSSLLSGIYFAGIISAWLFNSKPKSIPRFIQGSLHRIVDFGSDGGGYRDLYYNVLNQGLRQMKFYGYAVEISFPLENFKFVEAIDRMLELAVDEADNYSQYEPAPLAVRFVHPSQAYLSMMSDRASCMVEVVSLVNVIGGKNILERIEREMYKYEGRPHWGLNLDTINAAFMAKSYPKFGQWMNAFKKFNSSGVFNGSFTDRTGISDLAGERFKENDTTPSGGTAATGTAKSS